MRDDGGDLQKEALRRCLAELPARSRRAVELRYGEGRSRDAIAAELELTPEGAKSLLMRIRRALGDCIRRKTDDSEDRG